MRMSSSLGQDTANKQVAGVSQTDPLEDVESFLRLFENPTKTPPRPKKGLKRLNQESLIKILESQSPSLKVAAGKSRRIVTDKLVQKKKFAEVDVIRTSYKLETVKRLRKMAPERCTSKVTYQKKLPETPNEKFVVVETQVFNDSHTVVNNNNDLEPIVRVKEEIVDLTDDSWGLTVHLNFAEIHTIQQCDFEKTEDLFGKAMLIPHLVDFGDVIVTEALIFDAIGIPVIDLREDSDVEEDSKFFIQQSLSNNNNNNSLPIVDSKTCIDYILPIVYRFYKLRKLNKRMEDALKEANARDINSVTGDFSKKMISIGYDLVQYLSNITIIKFDFNEFINKLYITFKEKYHEPLLGKNSFIVHLSSMVEENRNHCKSELSKTFVDCILLLNDENEASGLSPHQLDTLSKQVEHYKDIVSNQRRLFADLFARHPELYDSLMFYPEIFSGLKDASSSDPEQTAIENTRPKVEPNVQTSSILKN